MNGVGYYEMDSVVQACEQYLKALEIMEEHYEEKDLVGYKAKFMALVYTHLCGLFSDQYLHEQAIYFGKHSLPYYYCYEAELGHIAWMHSILGVQYDMLERWDSADYYYRQAMQVIPDSNTLIYRDVSAVRALLSYNINSDVWCSLKRLLGLLERSESEKEYLSRCAVIGEIFYREEMYDSAWNYLNPVYQGNSSLASKKQAAEWCDTLCPKKKWRKRMHIYSIYNISTCIIV